MNLTSAVRELTQNSFIVFGILSITRIGMTSTSQFFDKLFPFCLH